MARTRMAASRRHIVVRRALVAALTLAMTVGQVPTAAFAEALGADAAAVESLADGAQLAATNANLGAASEQGAEGGLAATVGQAGDEAQDAEGAVESDGEAEANAADAAGNSSPSDSAGTVDATATNLPSRQMAPMPLRRERMRPQALAKRKPMSPTMTLRLSRFPLRS